MWIIQLKDRSNQNVLLSETPERSVPWEEIEEFQLKWQELLNSNEGEKKPNHIVSAWSHEDGWQLDVTFREDADAEETI